MALDEVGWQLVFDRGEDGVEELMQRKWEHLVMCYDRIAGIDKHGVW